MLMIFCYRHKNSSKSLKFCYIDLFICHTDFFVAILIKLSY